MLLTYLYENFWEEAVFAEECGTTVAALSDLIDRRVFPGPSYLYSAKGTSTSFVSTHREEATYRFHLRTHTDWFLDVTRYGLHNEDRVRTHFERRYNRAKNIFLTGTLGRELAAAAPDVIGQFDPEHADMTWTNFLDGVYGVCTRDGMPETVFQKQAGVLFVESLVRDGVAALSPARKELLERAVNWLDTVASVFAPHEVPLSSRQRCILDIRAQMTAAAA